MVLYFYSTSKFIWLPMGRFFGPELFFYPCDRLSPGNNDSDSVFAFNYDTDFFLSFFSEFFSFVCGKRINGI